MNNSISNNKNLSEWAKQFTEDNKEALDYLLKFGTSFDKALVQEVKAAAEGAGA